MLCLYQILYVNIIKHTFYLITTKNKILLNIIIKMSLFNTFVSSPGGPTIPKLPGVGQEPGEDIISASGNFYDKKRYVNFEVDIKTVTSESYSLSITRYEVSIDTYDEESSNPEYFYFNPTSTPDSIVNRVSGAFKKTPSKDVSGPYEKGFPFVNLTTYAIFHRLTVTKTVGSTSIAYVLTHTQVYTHYDNAVTVTDFTFNTNVKLGDTLYISDLDLNHGVNFLSGSSDPLDETKPEFVEFRFNVKGVPGDADIYFNSHQPWNDVPIPGTDGALYEIQLPSSSDSKGFQLGNAYTIRAHAFWALGYDEDSISSDTLFLLNRPEITEIIILPLSVDDDSNIMKITLAVLSNSGIVPAPTKVWFEFKNSSDVLVASVGGDSEASGPGIDLPSNREINLKLSQIDIKDGVGLLKGVNYNVYAKVKYSISGTNEYRTSEAYDGDVIFAATPAPIITDNIVNTLYVVDANEKVLTIKVENAEYELFAPKVPQGIRFHFYDESVSTTTIYASTDPFPFENYHESSTDVEYNIFLSNISSSTPLVNGKDYRIKAEISLENHLDADETKKSVLDTSNIDRDRVNFRNEIPEILTISGFDVSNDGDSNDSSSQIVATIRVNQGQYELVAPNAIDGIRFLIYSDENAATLIATTDSYNFVNNSSDSFHDYDIQLNQINMETSGDYLENGNTYYVRAEVTVIKHSGSAESPLRLSNIEDVTFSQDISPLSSVVISNTWALATNNNPSSSSSSRFSASPLIGVSGNFNKTAQFDNAYNKDLDVTTTKYYLEYSKNGGSSWNDVTKAVLIHQGTGNSVSSSESLQEAVIRARNGSVVTSANGRYPNVVGARGRAIVFYIPQNQGSGDAFTESDDVIVRVSIIDTANLWAPGNNTSSVTESNSLTLINKIKTYEFFTNDTDREPWNSVDNDDLVLNIPVSWNSDFSHSVIVDYGYSSSSIPVPVYTYSNTFAYPTSTVSLYVEPTQGTTLYYRVTYIITNPNPLESAATHGLTSEEIDVPNRFFPSSSDYTISATDYETFNTGGRAAVLFTLTFNQQSNSRIDGVHVYFNSPAQQSPNPIPIIYEFEAGSWTNSNVSQFGGSGTPKLVGSSNNVDNSSNNSWSFSEATLVSTVTNSDAGTRTDTYSGSTFSSNSFTGQVNIEVTYDKDNGVTQNTDFLNTDFQITISRVDNGHIIFDFITEEAELVFDRDNNTITGTIPAPSQYYTDTVNYPNDDEITTMSEYVDSEYYASDSIISTTRIQTYTKSQGGSKNIQLLHADNTINLSSTGNFTFLRVMADNGTIGDSDSIFWRDYDSATFTVVPYRDRRVNSTNASYTSDNHIESAGSELGLTVWNVPKLQNPSFNGPIQIDGGIINSSVSTRLHWVAVYDMNRNPFKYDLTMMKNDTVSIHDDTFDNALTGGVKTLNINTSTIAKYTVTLALRFDPETPNAIRELSSADTITFYTVKVDNSNMNISVQVPSDISNVNLTWNEPVITGSSITNVGGSVAASFAENITKHYIEYSTTNPTRSLSRLAPSPTPPNYIERIVSPATKKQYALPYSHDLSAVYSFFMHIAASINYRVESVLHSASGSQSSSELKTTNSAKVLPTATTPVSQYVVSTIPIITLPSQTPVLLTGQNAPTLLLGLDANGLEDEGFISVMVILTQDGTASNPEGEHALLVFPDSGALFNYSNDISQTGGDTRLVPGDPYNSIPRDIAEHSMSTHLNQYTLTIGTVETIESVITTGGEVGRYGLSTLQMPSSENTGFVDGDVNYMIILTTRRGVDVKTGIFTYQSLPSVQNVQIVTENGQFFVQFDISPA